MWALVTVKGGTPLVEDIEKSPDVKSWGLPLFVAVDVPIARVGKECDWPKTPENFRRLEFCRKYEGYGSLCHCSKPLPLYTHPTYRVEPNHIANVPVAVIASNRPAYLFRMLRRLLSTPGSNPRNTVVFIDGFFPEVVGVAELVGVRAVQVSGVVGVAKRGYWCENPAAVLRSMLISNCYNALSSAESAHQVFSTVWLSCDGYVTPSMNPRARRMAGSRSTTSLASPPSSTYTQ